VRPTGPRIRRTQGRWTDWAILILSVWLFMSPWILSTIVVTTRGPDGVSFMARGANPADFWGGRRRSVCGGPMGAHDAVGALDGTERRTTGRVVIYLPVGVGLRPLRRGLGRLDRGHPGVAGGPGSAHGQPTRVRLASAHGTDSAARSPPDTMITHDRVSP